MTWDQELDEFCAAARIAIRETSDILLSEQMPARWRIRLEDQVEELRQFVSMADRYAAERRRSRLN